MDPRNRDAIKPPPRVDGPSHATEPPPTAKLPARTVSTAAQYLVAAVLNMRDAMAEIRANAADPESVSAAGQLAQALMDAGGRLGHNMSGHTLRQALERPSTNVVPDPALNIATGKVAALIVACLEEGRLRPHRIETIARVAEIWPNHTSKAACDKAQLEADQAEGRARVHAEMAAHQRRLDNPVKPGPTQPHSRMPPAPQEPPDLTVG